MTARDQFYADFPWHSPEPSMQEYGCPYRGGCAYTQWAEYVPECPLHHQRMVLAEQEQS